MKILGVKKSGTNYVFTIERTVTEDITFGHPDTTGGVDHPDNAPEFDEAAFVKACAERLQQLDDTAKSEVDLSHVLS